MNGRDPETLRAYCNEKCGVVLGHGIGELTGKAFRIAHMGHVNAPMLLGTLASVEMALAATGVPHGKNGVAAAVEYLANEVKA
jgi:alanine-glyoxylate transaminase/serine-glyoxylate transaminase/serine-pyruvate transaminase